MSNYFELLNNTTIDAREDDPEDLVKSELEYYDQVWQIGVVLYQLAAGGNKLPFEDFENYKRFCKATAEGDGSNQPKIDLEFMNQRGFSPRLISIVESCLRGLNPLKAKRKKNKTQGRLSAEELWELVEMSIQNMERGSLAALAQRSLAKII